jgi:hypothetical protein
MDLLVVLGYHLKLQELQSHEVAVAVELVGAVRKQQVEALAGAVTVPEEQLQEVEQLILVEAVVLQVLQAKQLLVQTKEVQEDQGLLF